MIFSLSVSFVKTIKTKSGIRLNLFLHWRVTLLSIHPGKLVVVPRKTLKLLADLISVMLPSYGIASVELSKQEKKQMSKELRGEV